MDVVRRSPRRPRRAGADICAIDVAEPAKKFRFVYTKREYDSLDLFHKAVCDAQKAGKADYWRLVKVVKDSSQNCVSLQCSFCSRSYSARNPSAALKDHFVKLNRGTWTCKVRERAQMAVNENEQLCVKGAA